MTVLTGQNSISWPLATTAMARSVELDAIPNILGVQRDVFAANQRELEKLGDELGIRVPWR